MFAWKLILVLAMSRTFNPSPIPVEYLLENSPPITIQAVDGNPTDDFAQAGRILGSNYNETLGCRIDININSKLFQGKTFSSRDALGAAMVKYLNDGTAENKSPKIFILAHEVGHCFDNETLPVTALGGDGYQGWKEGYADAFAILVLKQQGVPETQLNTLVTFREERLLGEFGKKWGAMLRNAAATEVTEKSDKDLLAIAREIRRNVWKSS